ncbi:TPA: tail fiber assembly protein [Escherichia coli]|nr:tail fiber assembly protein [Escherichia coli]
MIHLKGFMKYKPVSPLPEDFPEECLDNPNIADLARKHHFAMLARETLEGGRSTLFEHDENGRCWYDSVLDFQKDTYKIVYNPATGQVIGFDKDATKLFPHGNNVVEVKSVPKDFAVGTWKFDVDSEHLLPYDKEIVSVNKLKQTRLLQAASAHWTALSCMLELRPHEAKEAEALRQYMVAVKRIDVSDMEPEWPISPI